MKFFKKMKDLFTGKSGQITFGNMPQTILTIVLIAAIAVGGFLAIDGIESGLVANSAGANASLQIEEGLDNVFDQFPTIGTLLGVGLMLFVIVVGFSVARGRGLI